ncbi:hypothetical protein B6A14_09155 [Polynucleobacter hirudinilacicola]|uniref:Peptidase metallopeptidase domain-containing protein n=1 Tax=Polynucleobacter hirudinilacicola TaxID=1743166 RepID=A0A210RY78_9BURK|nr:M10 family metallopeptidase C-terminal domain-containing protein [Polynucleobacter hirudinilacicola]OWF65914.1 hypothetical protein B6A14_09155 [Polynucleobacter hirudinilacicola]
MNNQTLFDPLLNSLQTSFFARTNPNVNAVISTATSPYATTLFPAISIGPNLAEKVDALATIKTTYTLAVGQTARGEISAKGDHDFYKVSLVAGQTYTFAEIGTGVSSLKDPFLAIVNASGKRVASNDDGGPGSSALLTYKPTASGTYFIDAGAFNNGSTGQYGVSVTAGTKASFDIEMAAGALDSYTSWGSLTSASAVNVTYSFRSSAPTTYAPPTNFSPLSSEEITAVKAILKLWSDVAQVTFTQVVDTTINGITEYSNNGTMAISNYSANDGAGAFAYYPGSTAASSSAGDLWLNLAGGVSTSGVTPGTYPFFAIMHEAGHALGLAHPGDYNAGVGVSITYANSAQFVQDTEMYSVMSYFGGSYTGGTPGGFATAYTPMLLDIYEIQQMYGANTATRATNTTYGFNATSDAQTSFSMTTAVIPQFCIWDGGGVDTLDCSGYSAAQNISLIAGTFSSVDGGTNNVSIALNCAVENAIGGSGNDSIVANASVNQLTGGAGTDIFKYFSAADSGLLALDRILDFAAGDKLDLSVLDANTATTANDVFKFIGGNQFSGVAGELRFDALSGQVQANMDANVNVDFAVAVNLIGGASLADTSFVL